MAELLLFGATGMVGQQVAELAAADDALELVYPVRSQPQQPVPGVRYVVIDFGNLATADLPWRCDALLVALGTTIAKAGSREAFAAIDHDLVIDVARRAHAAGTSTAAVVSSLGANARSSNFYLQVKGKMEAAFADTGFSSSTILRPSLLAGERNETRIGERVGLLFARLARPLIPRRYRAVEAKAVARRLLQAALAGEPGHRIIESEII